MLTVLALFFLTNHVLAAPPSLPEDGVCNTWLTKEDWVSSPFYNPKDSAAFHPEQVTSVETQLQSRREQQSTHLAEVDFTRLELTYSELLSELRQAVPKLKTDVWESKARIDQARRLVESVGFRYQETTYTLNSVYLDAQTPVQLLNSAPFARARVSQGVIHTITFRGIWDSREDNQLQALRQTHLIVALEELFHATQLLRFRLNPKSSGLISRVLNENKDVLRNVRQIAYWEFRGLRTSEMLHEGYFMPLLPVIRTDLEMEADFYAFLLENGFSGIEFQSSDFNGYPTRAAIEKFFSTQAKEKQRKSLSLL